MHITSCAAAIAILSFTGVDAFFRLPCAAPLVIERADPVVNPGTLAGHVHTIMGGNGFGFTMDFASTQASTCSSCRVKSDMSNYWVPTLYHKNDDGTFTSVEQIGGGLIYYLQRSDPQDPEFSEGLLAFPENFRMLAGTPALRSFSETKEQRAISYACLGVPGEETNHFPLQNCPSGVRAQVFFPSCWDGKRLDSDDHKSHMAYPDRVDSGKCPASHPKRFISLFYEVTWDTAKFNPKFDVQAKKQPFVWSNGDETGYGYHGDFVNGWDVPTLQRAVTECTNDSGNIEDCKVFELFSSDFSNSCKIPTSVDEQVSGTLNALPGCNPSTGEGPNAPKAGACGAPTSISPPSNPFVDLTASKKFSYIGCGKDDIGGRSLTGASLDQEDMTTEKCVDFCISKGFSIAGTEYGTECYCGNSLPQDRAPVDGLMGDCFMPCSGDENENCGGRGTISLYQRCGATCENISYGANRSPVENPAAPAAPIASSKAAVVPVAAPAASNNAAIPTPKAIVKAPAAPADEEAVDEAEPIEIVSASSAMSNAQPATTSKADAAEGVVPGSVSNTKIAPKCAAEVTVTVAATTITVTERSAPSSAPETGVKIPVDEDEVDEEEDNSPIPTSADVAEQAYPTITPTGGPFNNGTTRNCTTGNGKGKDRKKGHGRFHHSRRFF